MAEESLYIIGSTADYQARYDYYIEKGYDNRGSIIFSNDGTKVLLEESADVFEQEDLDKCEFIGTAKEARKYIAERPDEWFKDPDEDN